MDLSSAHPTDPRAPGRAAGLLASKLAMPRVPLTYVARPAVARRLDEGTRRPLTVVSAGAGWGKTLAVAHWAASSGHGRVAWVSLGDRDNEPRAFWSYVVAAVADLDVVPAEHPLAQLVPGLGDEDEFMSRLMAELAALPTTVILVLDDFHVIHEPVVHRQLTELLGQRIEQLRLVLLTRSDPPLPLHRLRVSDELGELRSRDLAFTSADASRLLDAHEIAVTADDAGLLVDRTEGWPAGLRLAALHLTREGGARSASDFAGDDQAVAGYLAEEVLASQPPEMQEFLLRTSITERVTADLARRLTGDERAQHHFESLEASNAFVVGLGPGRQWFRYHALLREMLQHRLRAETPWLVAELHTTAAHWLAENGLVVEALNHAAEAEDWGLLGRLFVLHGFPHVVSVERTAVHHALSRVPPPRYADSADLALCGAAFMFHDQRLGEMKQLLTLAVSKLDGGPLPDRTEECVALFYATVARVEGDASAVATNAAAALTALSRVGQDAEAGAIRAIALSNLGVGQAWCAQLTAAEQTLSDAVLVARESRIEVTGINALSHLGLVKVAGGHVTDAIACGHAATELVERRGWAALPQAAMAHLALTLAALHRDDLRVAEDQIVRARVAARLERISRAAVELVQVRLDLVLGRTEAASAHLSASALEQTGWRPPRLLERARNVVRAEVCLAAGDPEGAVRLLRQPEGGAPVGEEVLVLARAWLVLGEHGRAEAVLDPLRHSRREVHQAEAWVLTALLAESGREENRALSALGRAVSVAAPHHVRRPFVQNRVRLERLWERFLEVEPATAPAALDLLPVSTGGHRGGSSDGPVDDLTDREHIVLRYLATMRTNEEIAEELFVSVNTVKAHLKRLFRKLGVDSRREAVRRGREMGLIGDSAPGDERRVP